MNNANAHGAGGFKIDPAMPEWTRWLEFYRSSGMAKLEARMLAAIANAKRSRQQWLNRLLLEILSSDCPLEDVEIQEHPGPRTVIAIRGEAVHALVWDVSFVVPSAVPPALPRAANVMAQKSAPAPAQDFKGDRRSLGDGEFDAIVERLEKRITRHDAEAGEQKDRRRSARRMEERLDDALAAVQENRRPDVDDASDLDISFVEDPNEAEQLVHVGKGPPMRVRAKTKLRARVRSIRDDPIGQMAKRKQLGKDADVLLAAAREWQKYHEASTLGAGSGLNPFREAVDGGGGAEIDLAKITEANKQLASVRKAIGVIPDLRILGVRLLEWVLADRLSLNKIAQVHFGVDASNRLKLSAHLQWCLQVTAVVFGQAAEKTGPRRRRDRFDRQAAPVDRFSHNEALSVAIHRADKLRESECRKRN